jgi:hypothetical protein
MQGEKAGRERVALEVIRDRLSDAHHAINAHSGRQIAVVAPMPTANVSKTVKVRPGFLSNPRPTKWRFLRGFRRGTAWRHLYAHYLAFFSVCLLG